MSNVTERPAVQGTPEPEDLPNPEVQEPDGPDVSGLGAYHAQAVREQQARADRRRTEKRS